MCDIIAVSGGENRLRAEALLKEGKDALGDFTDVGINFRWVNRRTAAELVEQGRSVLLLDTTNGTSKKTMRLVPFEHEHTSTRHTRHTRHRPLQPAPAPA
jgi:hypothetical protein